nr:MAG TPA: hypothetical protein [Caudoviricetes sp.]
MPNWSFSRPTNTGWHSPARNGPVELVPNWSSRIGAKLVLLSTHKYWMALACAKLKIFKNESKSL